MTLDDIKAVAERLVSERGDLRRPTTRPKARIEDTPLSQWTTWFEAKTPLRHMAAITLVSTPTIAKWRRKLGFEGYKQGGEYRQLYTRNDAKKIAKHRTAGVSLAIAGQKAGFSMAQTYTIAMRFRDILPKTNK